MVAYNFLQKCIPWQSKSYDMSTISLVTSKLDMVKIGLKLMKLQPEGTSSGMLSVMLPDDFTLTYLWNYHNTLKYKYNIKSA